MRETTFVDWREFCGKLTASRHHVESPLYHIPLYTGCLWTRWRQMGFFYTDNGRAEFCAGFQGLLFKQCITAISDPLSLCERHAVLGTAPACYALKDHPQCWSPQYKPGALCCHSFSLSNAIANLEWSTTEAYKHNLAQHFDLMTNIQHSQLYHLEETEWPCDTALPYSASLTFFKNLVQFFQHASHHWVTCDCFGACTCIRCWNILNSSYQICQTALVSVSSVTWLFIIIECSWSICIWIYKRCL